LLRTFRIARRALALTTALALLGAWVDPSAAEDFFELRTFENRGRSVAAELIDVNGDGRTDLFVVALVGVPPNEKRTIRVYLQAADGQLPSTPSHVLPLPKWSAVYDVADVRPEVPGVEMLLLRPSEITILSLATAEGQRWDLEVPGPTGAGLAADERGLERYRIVSDEFGDEPWLLAPQLGQLTALTATGEVKAQVALARRANFFIIPETGIISLESDFQIFVDAPKLSVGDVDGDGRTDIVSATRHEVRVFLRNEDGSYAFEPSRVLALNMVTPRDHIRGSGGVTADARDVDGDGVLDLLVSHTQGSVRDATTTTYLFMNKNGAWNIDKPDQSLGPRSTVGSNAVYDLNGDGNMELVMAEVSFSLFEFIELLLSQEIDATLTVHQYEAGKGFNEDPMVKKSFSAPFSFDTFRLKGFMPRADVDVNNDGFVDFVDSSGGEAIEIFLGDREEPWEDSIGEQELDTRGVIHFGDVDGDGLQDFVIFDPHNFDVPVRFGRNLGSMPGTPPRLSAPPE
jgi:hypothetical protein